MKDNLFDLLINFFEKSLTQITEKKSEAHTITIHERQSLIVRSASTESIRVFTEEEQTRFTKASYQFIMRIFLWGIIASDTMELIINQLLFSDSRYITLAETKWTIRNTLAENLTAAELFFLDLVLYHKEDGIPAH